MSRTFRFLAVLALGSLLFAACGDSDDGGGDGGDDEFGLVEAGNLTVCSDIPYAPFEYEEGGQLKGIDIDLMEAVAENLDLSAEFLDTDFDGIFASLAAGNCDVIASSVSITDERKQANNFSQGYFEINQSLLVRKGDEGTYKDFASLKGKTVGVQSGTTGADFATEEGGKAGVQIKEFTGADDLFTALKAKQIDGIVQDFPVNSYNAKTTGDTVVSAKFESGEPEEYGIVVPKKSTDLLQAIDDELDELRSSGEYDKILEEYLGDQATSS
jgi:polar amino acid transport system substrate-binding protein